MNSSFTKELQKSNIKEKLRNIYTERENNKNNNKVSNLIQSLKKNKHYYKKSISKKEKKNIYESIAYKKLIKKYNYTSDKYNLLCVNYLLNNSYCHLVSEFKEKMISDYIIEFLRRQYTTKEAKERIPKFYLYYKHYSIFFGQPFFKNFIFNKLIQKNGEKKARIYYKNHYQNGESKDEGNENLGFAQSESGNEGDNENTSKLNNKKRKISHIFDSSIKENIDNATLMTTINSFENNTINLKLNNEKIEIFSENKTDKSNDTTLGEIINYINKKDLEEKKEKSKNIKKKNYSIGENIFNLLNKNNKKIYINENNKKKLIELINTNNNSMNKKIRMSSIKRSLIKTQNNNTNTNTNNTQRNVSHSKNNANEEKIKKKIISNKNLNSNRVYKKVKLLSFVDDDINNLINSNMIRSSRNRNINKNIKLKKPGLINNNNTNNKYINKIKISKTLKNITDRNIKRNATSNKKEKRKIELNNYVESQLTKDKKNNKKIISRNNYISPLNKKYTYNNKFKIHHLKYINNNKISLSNLSYQTINYEKGLTHQRTKSNNVENPLTYSKCLITERNKVYNKPYIRINKNEKIKKEINNINNEIKTSINENYNSLMHQKSSFKSFNDLKNNNNNNYNIKEQNNKKVNLNNYNKKSNFSKYIMEVIKTSNSNNKYYTKNANKNKDIFQIAFSLMNNQNNLKKNYNLNININNEININENNNINNSTFSLNNLTQRINTKNINNKNFINLKQNKNKKETINSYRSNYPFSKKKINGNSININQKKGKKIKKRNYEKNFNEALTTINNNLVNSILLNNSLENNNNNKINIKNNKKFKKYHTKSITNLIDLMNHNKRLMSLYRNLNKSK